MTEEKIEQENNKLLDVINNQDVKIADLEKKVKEYEQQISAMEKGVCDVCKVKDADYYEKQIADLEEDLKLAEHNLKVKQGFNDNQYVYGLKISNQLEQAKKIILMLYNAGRNVLMCGSNEETLKILEDSINAKEIEQFIKGTGNDRKAD